MTVWDFIDQHLWFSFFTILILCLTLDSIFGHISKIWRD